MSRPIYIIGSGAVGKVLAAFLRTEYRDVTLIHGRIDEGLAYTELIRVQLENGSILEAEIRVSTLGRFATLDGIIVLTNKSFGNERLAAILKGKVQFESGGANSSSPIVILQNGLGIEDHFTKTGFTGVYRCVLFMTSQFIEGNLLRFKPVSSSPIGIIKGNTGELNQVVDHLDNLHFRFHAESDIQPVIWKKAIANCVFNSICPLLEADNGIFHRNPAALQIARKVVEECVPVALAIGIALDPEEVVQNILRISRASDGQLISTLQDIRNSRRTEIDTLNFEIVRMAKLHGIEHLVKETQLLGELILLKSNLSIHQ